MRSLHTTTLLWWARKRAQTTFLASIDVVFETEVPGREWEVVQGICSIQEGREYGVHVIENAIALFRGRPLPKKIAYAEKRLEYAKAVLRERYRQICENENYNREE